MEPQNQPHKKSALVVDDNELVREFVGEVLESQGFEVFTAEDGQFAIATMREHPAIALIVTDIVMPYEDGIQFMREVREGTKDSEHKPKIIAMSGGGYISADVYLQAASHLGADIVLPKPFSDTTLINAIQKLDLNH